MTFPMLGRAIFAAVIAGALTAPSPMHAQESPPYEDHSAVNTAQTDDEPTNVATPTKGRSDTLHLDVMIEANHAARNKGALAVIITHGDNNSDPDSKILSPQEFSTALRKSLDGVKIDLLPYYIQMPEAPDDTMSITFTNGHTGHGPMGPNAVGEELQDIVNEYRRYEKLFPNILPENAN